MTTAEPAPDRQTISAEDLAWEEPRRGASLPSDAPLLRVEGFEGPLDWLLEQVRAGRVDLARLSVLALVEQCVAALETALLARRGQSVGDSAGAGPVPLQRLAEWVGMAAWLAWLRSRLLLPPDAPEAQAAREEAEALRRGLVEHARMRGTAAWLDARAQLGRDVFVRGMPGRAGIERATDLPALLRTYARLMGPLPEPEKEEVYRPRPPPLWRVPDALARLGRLLPELLDAAADGVNLWRFLPDRESLAASGRGSGAVPDPALLCRSSVASTFVAALELARSGTLTLGQEAFGDITVRGALASPLPEQGAGAAPGEAVWLCY